MPTSTAPPVVVYSPEQRVTFVHELRDLVDFWHLLTNLVQRDLTVRYKRSVLGFLWTMLNPLLLMIIFVIVFSVLFRFAIKHYETYFLSEFLIWNFFVQTTTQSIESLEWNGALMNRVRVPKTIFALSTAMSGLVNLALSCIPLVLIMLYVGAPLSWPMLFLPVAFLINAVFALGVSLALSALAVYFNDVSPMYQVATTGWLYLTPVIYPIEIVPEKFRFIIGWNPLTHLLDLVRGPIFRAEMPSLHAILVCTAISLAALAIGWLVFRRLSRGFYLHL